MENRKLLKKHIQEFTKRFSNKNNFHLYKRTFAIREIENLLHIVCFDFPPSSMQCHVAIQPLYVPETQLHFSFGNLLNYFGTQRTGLWGVEESGILSDIEEISNLLERNVLPWFNKISSPNSLIDFINSDKFSNVMCTPFLRNLYLGFSYLYTKRFDLANENLINALNATSDFIEDYKMENINLIEPLLKKINEKEFSAIENDLHNFVNFTRASCNLGQD